nr:hypothetical protein [uncultured Sphingomonas sp.]
MLVAAPAFAQDKPATETTQPQQQTPSATQSKPETPATTDDSAPGTQGSGTVEEAPSATPAPATESAQPTPTQPATPAQPAQPGTAPADSATPATPAQPGATPSNDATAGTTGAGSTATQPATTPEQVTQAVGRDFGTYDKDSNGSLSQAEFGAWVGTLRKASDPAFAPGSPEADVWAGQAFAQADADKNKSISQAEVATFLTPKP